MTRRVQFSSQQRVDQPDALAIGTFATQDARRILRTTLMGSDAVAGVDKGRILNGFRVDAFDPGVAPQVIVRLDNGGGNFSSVMAAINNGAGQIDWGQIGGDRDGVGNLEGSAQLIFDFTGQAPAIYQVSMRLQFSPGILDNRAFWNPATNAEFVQPTNTRLLPQWEINLDQSDAEWVLLASVDWDGVSVNTNDIIDLRAFPLEGDPKNTALVVDQWAFPAQTGDADTFGVGDFDRGADRAEVQARGVWAGMRALARQIQDIKGARDSDQRYDWFSRPSSAPGFFDVDNNIATTRTMRMMDTVTFTCADGVTDQGDFTGLDSIFECFKFIQDNPADVPRRITILVKSRGVGTPAFTWTDNITIVDKDIMLIGSGGAVAAGDNNPIGLVQLTAAGPGLVTGNMLTMSNLSSLHMENILLINGTGIPEVVGLIEMSQRSEFSCDNCFITSGNLTDAGAVTLRCPSSNLGIKNSLIVGLCFIGGKPAPSPTPPLNDRDRNWQYGRIENTQFSGHIRFRYDNVDEATADDVWFYANNVRVEGCTFTTVVLAAQVNAATDGMVDLAGCRNMQFSRCNFAYAGDETGVTIKGGTVIPGSQWSQPENISFDDCIFKLALDAEHAGTLSGAGGVSGSLGTGWAINMYAALVGAGSDPLATTLQMPRHIRILGCQFDAGINTATSNGVVSPADAGYVNVLDCKDVHVEGTRFVHWTEPTAGQTTDLQLVVVFQTTTTGKGLGSGIDHAFVDSFIGDWQTISSGKWGDNILMNALRVFDCDRMKIRGSTISALLRGTISSATPEFGALPTALVIQKCTGADVEHNFFVAWREPGSPLNNTCVGLSGDCVGCNFVENRFEGCGGANIIGLAGATQVDCHFTGNRFLVGQDESLFASIIDLTTDTAPLNNNTYIGNSWDFVPGTPNDAIRFQATVGVFQSNALAGGRIVNLSGVGPFASLIGYNNASQEVNLVNGYFII
ncbi:MAG: hypothetical protein O7G84_13665 [Gammaproteobacteria bacterium]|nr:hypothetical protein [Gammaproteobacteria bacterium]